MDYRHKMHIGNLFLLGFYGKIIPPWLKEFATEYGLGGVILFDDYYGFGPKVYENNIESPVQLRHLCEEIHCLPSQPMVFMDQEGGLVRVLKEEKGFQPLPDQKALNLLTIREKRRLLTASFRELRELGVNYNLAPVIDVDYNPKNPSIGKVRRSYSANIKEVEENALLAGEIAQECHIGLCLKHYPGIGAAKVDSHHDFMDISNMFPVEQEELFYSLAPKVSGNAILVSHGIVNEWDDSGLPITVSEKAISRLRKRLPDTLLITDDMQMQGIQKALGTRQASLQALKAGFDMLCISNNLINQESEMLDIAHYIIQKIDRGMSTGPAQKTIEIHKENHKADSKVQFTGNLNRQAIQESIERVLKRKNSFIPNEICVFLDIFS